MIDVLKYRGLSLLVSLSIIAATIGGYVYKERSRGYAFSYSVDYTGGTQVIFKFDTPVSTSEVKEILEKKGWAGAATREFSEQEILVRVKEFSNDAKGLADRMRKALAGELKGNNVVVLQNEGVSPGVGADLRWKSFRAVFFALLAMLAYIAWRFWSAAFALGAVVALFHDAMVMLAVFLLFDREISVNVIGAILAVLGYSINDTIVIFAQIRDNLKKMKDAPLGTIVNKSINHTLKRTMLTSLSTGLTVGSMFFLGGEALRDFSLALLVGIIFGTYSSIFIASPVMMRLYKPKV